MCNQGTLGDEFYLILVCTAVRELRTKYIPNNFETRPNVPKFASLLNTQNSNTLLQLANFIQKATSL